MIRKSKCIILLIMCLVTLMCACGASKENVLEDGHYMVNVSLEGGTGKATVESPTSVTVEDGKVYATLVWSSPNYDYMIVDGEKYINEAEAGNNSVFTIPIPDINTSITVIADTTAMSVPHEIEYILTFSYEAEDFSALNITDSLELKYAIGYTVDWYGQYCYIKIPESGEYLLVPEGVMVPKNVPDGTVILKMPLDHTYLVATSAMDMINKIGALDNINLSGTKAEDWYIADAKNAMESGDIIYAGKYSAPDYELILKNECSLAIESTMIYHTPEVKEKLEELGIPVFVERSSYEEHPLGRLEWIKLYGILYGCEEEAVRIYDEAIESIEPVMDMAETGKSVAFFYVTANGMINVRKPNDYISKMIELAGGIYVLSDIIDEEDNALSTMNMNMEDFYVAAKDADYIIYNSTIEGELDSIDDLVAYNELFLEFKAVKEGNVYCTSNNFFQETTSTCEFINEVHDMLSDKGSDYRFLKKLL